MSKKILIVTGDAGESYETLYAVHRMLEADHLPVIAAPSARRLHLVMHDFEPGWDTYVERPGYGIDAHITFDEVNPAVYDAILLIGGRAPEYLRHNHKLLEITRAFHESGKWVFSICHGVQILIAAGLAKGRTMTCYENVRNEVEIAGGKWSPQEAYVEDRIVTGQTWQSHPDFYREVFRCLNEN